MKNIDIYDNDYGDDDQYERTLTPETSFTPTQGRGIKILHKKQFL